MKASRKITSVFLLLIAIIIALGWWVFQPEKQPPQQPANADTKTTPDVAGTEQTPTQTDMTPQMVQPFARTPYLGVSDPRWKEYWRMREADRGHEWKTPIEFFGKVVDENNQPVEGATVDYQWSGNAEKYGGDGVEKRSLESDASGLFYIHGIEGKGMSIYVKKRGYKVRGYPQGSYEYAGFWEPRFIEPDRNKPIIFRLVKRPEGEPTFHVAGWISPPPPNLEAHIDLMSPTAQSDAVHDLQVRIARPPNASYEKPFTWSVVIQGKNGAELREATDEFMLIAPEEGYRSALVFDYNNRSGGERQKARFYVRNATRKFYAAVTLEMAAYRRINGGEPASIDVSAIVNPNDSRNVDYNEKLDIRRVENK